MPINIQELGKKIRPVTFEFMGEKGTLHYRAGANTARAAIEWQERFDSEEENQIELLAERLTEIIDSWDLVDGDKPLPVTQDTLLDLPMPLLEAMMRAIIDSQNPQTRKSRR